MFPYRHAWRGRLFAACAAATLTGTVATAAALASSAPQHSQTTHQAPHARAGENLSGEISAALRRDLHVSAQEARRQEPLQARAIELDRALQASLGRAFAGSFYDAKTGKLIVTVSDPKQLAKAKAGGANARLVKHSKAELGTIKDELDVAAGKAKGDDPANRQASGTRQASVAGMTSWAVDPTTNSVHVTVTKANAKAATRTLAKYGNAVTIEQSDLQPRVTANYMDGGDAINYNSCSAGFNLRNPSTGQGYLLTAGHCVSAGSTLRGQDGVAFGPVLESWYPIFDDAIARNDSGGYWRQGPWLDTNPSNGYPIVTNGYTDAPPGTWICKSGITTKWTCGQITAKDLSVVYKGNTYPVTGLTRHNACVEPGDSGGANVSVTTKYSAEGVTSAAVTRWDGSRWRCLATFGQPNVSYYFPIAHSLAYYGLKYGVTVW